MPAAKLYLDLLKRCLTGIQYEDPALDGQQFDLHRRQQGVDWPTHAETMVGSLRLDSLQRQVEQILMEGVPGDLIETGVWRGGASILMAAILAAHGVTDRTVWVADSFTGMPISNHPADGGTVWPSVLAVDEDQVRANFARYGLLGPTVRFLPGLFADTLPTAPIDKLALMRLDGDLYMSTMDALTALYPRLSPGGYVVIDDYGAVTACRRATDEYRAQYGITQPLESIDWTGRFWRKP